MPGKAWWPSDMYIVSTLPFVCTPRKHRAGW